MKDAVDFRQVIEQENDYNTIIDCMKSEMDPILFKKHQAAPPKDYCGKLFVKGDIVYSCKDCGLDGTCVLCVECFKSTNHERHNVSYHFSHGNGGCCDCGDLEAWKVPLLCKIHTFQ
eukprot:NODE_161_length_16629_cov_0.427344.p10 type:complete len:117 gc:universal NODE_161_length_16629_cov_0.427344:3670-3320(-)